MDDTQAYFSYMDLEVWKLSIDLAADIFEVIRTFPQSEAIALGSQYRRAATSVAQNIAEGSGRGHPKEFIQFFFIANGSLREVETLTVIAHRTKLMTDPQPILERCAQIGRMLTGLRRSIEVKLPNH